MAEEIVDIVDENDKVIGKGERGKVHSSNTWHRGVHIFVFNTEGKLLVERRISTKDIYPDYYGCSVSEHVKAGESYEEAAGRGLMEELGIGKAEIKELAVIKIRIPEDLMINRFYEAKVGKEDLKMQAEEKEGIEFMGIGEIQKHIRKKEKKFAPWFLECFEWYMKHKKGLQKSA